MSNWNKPILAQPGAGMSVLVNTLSATPGAKPVVLDIGPSCQSFLSVDGRSTGGFVSAPPRTGMSVLVNQEMLALASGMKQAEADTKPPSVVNVIRDSILSVFNTLGNIVLEEVLLTFRTRSGKDLLINPFDQASIDAAKNAAPGEGVGPAVSAHLVELMGRGLIQDATLLPSEYRHLGVLIGTTQARADAVLSNCNTSIQLNVRS